MTQSGIICEILLVINTFFYLAKIKDIFHPSVIVCGIWMIIITIYNHQHVLFPISNNLYWSLTSWALIFSFSCFLTTNIKFPVPKITKLSFCPKPINKTLYYVIITINLIFSCIMVYNASFEISVLRDVQIHDDVPKYIILYWWVYRFSLIYLLGFLLYYNRRYTFKKILLLLIMFFAQLTLTNKTGYIIYFCGIVYLCKCMGEIKLRKILFYGFLLAISLFLVMTTRGDTSSKTFTWTDAFFIYLLSPLPAMDMVMNNSILFHGAWGDTTFKFFYNVMSFLNIEFPRSVSPGWYEVPLPTNVYTVIYSFYHDFGYIGIGVFAIILGSIWGYIYNLQRKGYPIYILFYASMIFSLVVQFFSDYFFGFFSDTIQNFIYSIMVCYLFSAHKSCNSRFCYHIKNN